MSDSGGHPRAAQCVARIMPRMVNFCESCGKRLHYTTKYGRCRSCIDATTTRRVSVAVALDIDSLVKVEAIAERDGTTRAELIRQAVAVLLDRREAVA